MLEDTEPYFTRIQKSMFDIISGASNVRSEYFRRKNTGKGSRALTAIIAITSDKGLAGGYNANVFRQVLDLCTQVKNPVLILIGAIGNRYFEHTPYVVLENFSFHSQMPTLEQAGEIADFIISQFLWGMFEEVHVVYTHMFSTIKLLPVKRQILPLDTEKLQSELSGMGNMKREELTFEFLPSEEVVFNALVPLYIRGTLYGCIVEAYASEQSARMAAMDEASKNAEDMLGSLQIAYNRVRQANITQEISEIVSGSAALGDK
jgi:F-type H+-transporting ATPase subunit gamma